MPKISATSFINEHTAEYYLAIQLKQSLEQYYKYVTPIFPWITREASNVSKSLHKYDQFYALIIFPRRPKFDSNDEIFITINEELLQFKDLASKYNYPVIAGVPIAHNFWDLSKHINILWLRMDNDLVNNYLNPINSLKQCILNINDIVKLIDGSTPLNMHVFEDFLRETRSLRPTGLYGQHYKPVYFLIKLE